VVWRGEGGFHRLATGGYGRIGGYGVFVAIRCQAVDCGASNASTVWRQVATGDRWLRRAVVAGRPSETSAMEDNSLLTTMRAQTRAINDYVSEKAP
jgi:hypothetical protein